jgi:cell division protein ZapA (FtsZ GTPase activity inhibitor)
MSGWAIAVIIIVAIVAFTELQKSKHRTKNGIALDWLGGERPIERENTELKREVEELRERVKVLERIAIDGRETRLLADEIDKLRDN